MQNNNSQSRLLLATALSFIFFIAYSYFYLEPQAMEREKAQQAQKVKQAKENKQTPTQNANTATSNTITPSNKNTQKETNAPSISTNALVNKVPNNNEFISKIETKENTIYIDNLGRISQIILKNKVYIDENGKQLRMLNPNKLRPLELRFANAIINAQAFKTNYTTNSKQVDATYSKQTIVLSQKLDDIVVTKTLSFYPDGHYDVDVSMSKDEVFYITNGYRADILADMYATYGALLYLNDDTLEIISDGSVDNINTYNNINILSSFDRYYAVILYNFDKTLEVTALKDDDDNPLLFVHAKKQISLHGYAGPKHYKALKKLDKKLTKVIEYGFFTFIAKPMFLLLQFMQKYIGNWGWTIVVTTILIKLVLFPLSYKGMMSMNRLKELSPKIKELQAKNKDNKQKASMAMMELYKKEKVNPMGGCFPILLQIPVFFAIYRVLINAIELKGSGWMLWIDDLALMDPYFVLPLLMGVSMYVQQKIQPNQIQDEMQKKIFQFLPVVFTVFFLWFPAGLTLYWLTNNLFTIAQQYYINTLFAKAKLKREQAHNELRHKK